MDFWDNSEKSQKILSEISLLRGKIKEYKKLKSDFEDLATLVEMSCQEEDVSSFGEIESELKKIKSNLETTAYIFNMIRESCNEDA